MNINLKKLKDVVILEVFGISSADAIEQCICIECREPALSKCYSDAGRREYMISGMCEKCFDNLLKGR